MTKVIVFYNRRITEKPKNCKNWAGMHKQAKVPVETFEVEDSLIAQVKIGNCDAIAEIQEKITELGIRNVGYALATRAKKGRGGFYRFFYSEAI
jgi:hypothetical protein